MKWFWAGAGILAFVSLTVFVNWPGTRGKALVAAVLVASLVVLLCGGVYGVFMAWRGKRWQFGLVTWFIVVAVAGLACAIPANHYVVRRPQLQLIPAITELGGSASIRNRYYHDRQLYSLWLMLTGQTDLFADFQGVSITDSDLRQLAQHPAKSALTKLRLDGSKITDAGLVHATAFPALRSLSFSVVTFQMPDYSA